MRLAVFFALVLAIASTAFAQVREPEGLVVLTVGGQFSSGNGAAPDPGKLGFFRYLELDYETAVGFDLDMLASLPNTVLSAAPFGNESKGQYSGPALSDVMRMVGAEGKTALPTALDGYQVEIGWETIVEHQPILATSIDGRPIAIGQLGPAIIVFPPVDDPVLAEELEVLSVFAVTYIGIE